MVSSPIEESCPSTEVNSARDSPERMYAKIKAARTHDFDPRHPPEKLAAVDHSDGTQDILRIVPLNSDARKAFDGVAEAALDGSLHPLHTQYICITGKCSLGPDSKKVKRAVGESSDEESSEPSTMGHAGYYRVNFALPSISKGPIWVRLPGTITCTITCPGVVSQLVANRDIGGTKPCSQRHDPLNQVTQELRES